MSLKPIPDGYHTLTPYLIVDKALPIIDFVKAAFSAVEIKRSSTPDGRIMNVELRIGNSMIMMGEARPPWNPMPCSLYVYVEDTDDAYRRAIEAGGKSLMEPANQFYGDRNAGVQDSEGNMWWIATHIEDVSPEELARRAEVHAAHQTN